MKARAAIDPMLPNSPFPKPSQASMLIMDGA